MSNEEWKSRWRIVQYVHWREAAESSGKHCPLGSKSVTLDIVRGCLISCSERSDRFSTDTNWSISWELRFATCQREIFLMWSNTGRCNYHQTIQGSSIRFGNILRLLHVHWKAPFISVDPKRFFDKHKWKADDTDRSIIITQWASSKETWRSTILKAMTNLALNIAKFSHEEKRDLSSCFLTGRSRAYRSYDPHTEGRRSYCLFALSAKRWILWDSFQPFQELASLHKDELESTCHRAFERSE